MEMLDDRAYFSPPDNEAEKIYECYFCDNAIYDCKDCYQIDNLIYCENCINKHFKIIPIAIFFYCKLKYFSSCCF